MFDGTTWRPGFSTLSRTPPHSLSGPTYRYSLTLEPHNLHWLLALDLPRHPDGNSRYTTDLQLVSVDPVRERRRYQLEAYPAAIAGQSEPGHVIRRNLRLPEGRNPRLLALGRDIAGLSLPWLRRS